MKKVLVPIIALLVLSTVAPVIAEPATKTQFAAEARFVPGNVSPGKGWITKDGIQHVKGAISEGIVSGDISGIIYIVWDETFDLNTGEGVNHGKLSLIADEGNFTGSFRSMITDYQVILGTFTAHGTGIYKGQKIMGSHEGELILDTIPVVELVLDGIMLSPKG